MRDEPCSCPETSIHPAFSEELPTKFSPHSHAVFCQLRRIAAARQTSRHLFLKRAALFSRANRSGVQRAAGFRALESLFNAEFAGKGAGFRGVLDMAAFSLCIGSD